MSQTVQFTREIPVRYTVDVFIAGGGPVGITAAIASAQDLSVHAVPIGELKTKLLDLGAYLPNA